MGFPLGKLYQFLAISFPEVGFQLGKLLKLFQPMKCLLNTQGTIITDPPHHKARPNRQNTPKLPHWDQQNQGDLISPIHWPTGVGCQIMLMRTFLRNANKCHMTNVTKSHEMTLHLCSISVCGCSQIHS